MSVEGAARPVRRRILLSAFACSPIWGSEPGVGWHWLVQLAKHHDVVLVTHAFFRDHIEPELAAADLKFEVCYVQAPAWGLHPHRQLNSRVYYTWWQWHARQAVRSILGRGGFDVVHHLTWGTLRFPCFLGGLGVPLVMGPLGGGESAPLRLFEGLPWKIRAFDYLRSLSLLWVRVDPLATWGPKRSQVVLCKSIDTLDVLPADVRARAVVVPEIGSSAADGAQLSPRLEAVAGRPFRLLFAGRLLGWKGVALALGATAKLIKDGLDVELDIAGEGPLAEHLSQTIDRQGLQGRVRLLGNLPRPELMRLYGLADLFLFPSLHDSSGNVVLESLSRGLPVMCLDVGGPQNYVDASCGVIVSARGRSREDLELALAQEVTALIRQPERLSKLARNAAPHAQKQTWSAAVQGAYGIIADRLHWSLA